MRSFNIRRPLYGRNNSVEMYLFIFNYSHLNLCYKRTSRISFIHIPSYHFKAGVPKIAPIKLKQR